jgi:hypothetical protein
LTSSCATTLSIQSDSDSQYDLSSYETYSVITPTIDGKEEMININPILVQRISRSIDSVLTQKGLRQSDNGDMTVKFFVGTKREVERATDLGGYGYYGYRYLDSRDQRYIRSDKDEISIRFHDRKTNDVIWYAFTRLKRANNQNDQASVDSLIQEVLSNFN